MLFDPALGAKDEKKKGYVLSQGGWGARSGEQGVGDPKTLSAALCILVSKEQTDTGFQASASNFCCSSDESNKCQLSLSLAELPRAPSFPVHLRNNNDSTSIHTRKYHTPTPPFPQGFVLVGMFWKLSMSSVRNSFTAVISFAEMLWWMANKHALWSIRETNICREKAVQLPTPANPRRMGSRNPSGYSSPLHEMVWCLQRTYAHLPVSLK